MVVGRWAINRVAGGSRERDAASTRTLLPQGACGSWVGEVGSVTGLTPRSQMATARVWTPWEIHGRSMGDPWEIHGRSMGDPRAPIYLPDQREALPPARARRLSLRLLATFASIVTTPAITLASHTFIVGAHVDAAR